MGDRGHEVIEHTADVGLRVWAPKLEEVFAEAAVGLIRVMGTATGQAAATEVEVEAPDLDALFVDWLSEVLFLFEARDMVPADARVEIERGTWKLRATLEGVRAGEFQQEGPAVKAITYHGLEISDTEAVVYLDV